jgi:hypothetical protein
MCSALARELGLCMHRKSRHAHSDRMQCPQITSSNSADAPRLSVISTGAAELIVSADHLCTTVILSSREAGLVARSCIPEALRMLAPPRAAPAAALPWCCAVGALQSRDYFKVILQDSIAFDRCSKQPCLCDPPLRSASCQHVWSILAVKDYQQPSNMTTTSGMLHNMQTLL